MLYITIFSDIRRFLPEQNRNTTETQPAPSSP
jgi:hypothetical protein